MNRGLTITGAVILALALIIPLAMAGTGGDGFEEALFWIFIVIPLASVAGLVGLVLFIVGLATGNRGQQQQQQIVVVTGGSFCTSCGQPMSGAAFCASCGVRA